VKLALISDIHANLEAFRATLADIAVRGVDRIVCLGDIVGYNTQPAECIALLCHANALCIAGNHDLAVCGRITTGDFTRTAARAVAWTQQHLTREEFAFLGGLPLTANIANQLIAVHGALHPQVDCATIRLDNDERRMQSFQALIAEPSRARICAFGHTHRAGAYEFRAGRAALRHEETLRLQNDAYYLINPGTVGQPRGRDCGASYMVLDLAQRSVTLHRVAYDSSVTLAATRKAGLAPAFAFIPAPVRGRIAACSRALRLERPMRQVATYFGF
jgi:predicted phosphodiesterase